ncbi:hypothetical protein [Sporolactobacillus putidus]|uniref:Uncharacterized protein n=1 Tax=Sporolactobacillus putidus TaxID=492735 RepID=A0A917S5A8_9BACL|nr:hypothetical protein [Sporolactobacillus putidus]GGL55616.1 hypothetical protein GCM10007968_19690 [Sporolactobacillus putidus]
MSAINALELKEETQEKSYRLFVEAKLCGFVDTKSNDKDNAIADVTALSNVETTLKNTKGKALPIDIADWDIDVKGIASPEDGEMEEVHLMTYQEAYRGEQPFRANLPQHIVDKLKAEQKRLYDLAEAHPDTHFHESRLNGFEKALSILGIYLPYEEDENK